MPVAFSTTGGYSKEREVAKSRPAQTIETMKDLDKGTSYE